jgi:transposase
VPPQGADESLKTCIRQAGPEHVGVLLVDSGKRHFAVRLGNFLGDCLWEPEPVRCHRPGLESMMVEVEKQMARHGLVELVVGIERTGRWHQPIKQLVEAKWPVKMISPFTTKRLRQPANPGVKTDPIDLTAMHRAMICGYGTDEAALPEPWLDLRLLSRARADLVSKRASLKTQCAGRMEALFPGYTDLFEDLWKTPTAAALIEAYCSPLKLLQAGTDRVMEKLSKAGVTCRRSTAERVRAWAAQAAPADDGTAVNHDILRDHLSLIRRLSELIDRYEVALLGYLVQTPAVLLLSITGINVASASDYGGEMGPDEHYIGPKNVTGRAGLFPSRFQSDEADRPNGPVVAGRNARLREAILVIGHNLLSCNPYFSAWRQLPDHRNMSYKEARIATGSRFVRISFQMLRHRTVFNHPIAGRQDSVLCKLVAFARDKGVPADRICQLAEQALAQLPDDCLAFERKALLCGGWNGRTSSPRPSQRPPRSGTRRPEYITRLVAMIERRMTADKGETPAISS